jgi:ribosome modulation factor
MPLLLNAPNSWENPGSARCLTWGSELVDGVYIELEKEVFAFRNTVRLRAIAVHSIHGQFDLGNRVVGLTSNSRDPPMASRVLLALGRLSEKIFTYCFCSRYRMKMLQPLAAPRSSSCCPFPALQHQNWLNRWRHAECFRRRHHRHPEIS